MQKNLPKKAEQKKIIFIFSTLGSIGTLARVGIIRFVKKGKIIAP